jgi:hypothetical protein
MKAQLIISSFHRNVRSYKASKGRLPSRYAITSTEELDLLELDPAFCPNNQTISGFLFEGVRFVVFDNVDERCLP